MDVIWAAVPLATVLYLMLGRKWSGSAAGLAGWLAAVLVALLLFGGNGLLVGVAFGKALLLALYVLYIVWMALLLYHTVDAAGAIKVIGQELPVLARDAAEQALLLAWVFGSFLQGAAGFGVPAAVVAPLLVGLGFDATTAVVIALVGHGWAVTFGSLGSSFGALLAATGLESAALAHPAAVYLGICCFLCGIVCVWAAARWHGLRTQWLRIVIVGGVMAAVQWGLAVAGFWHIAAFGGGLAGLLVIMLDFGRRPQAQTLQGGRLLHAFAPYLILIAVIVVGQFLLKEWLGSVTLNWEFPAVVTDNGWETPASAGRSLNLFGHAGALLLYTSLLAYGWFRWRGPFAKTYAWRPILLKTIKRSRKSTVSMVALLAMAVTMEHAGMTHILAQTLSQTGDVFPFLSPFIGALGSFMTGSNTSSNVVFSALQMRTAETLQLAIPILLAAQTAGGAIGSIFAPAKVVVGASTVSAADEAAVFRAIVRYGVVILFVLGVLTILFLSFER